MTRGWAEWWICRPLDIAMAPATCPEILTTNIQTFGERNPNFWFEWNIWIWQSGSENVTGFITRRLSNFPAVEQELVQREVGGILAQFSFHSAPASWLDWVYKSHLQGMDFRDLGEGLRTGIQMPKMALKCPKNDNIFVSLEEINQICWGVGGFRKSKSCQKYLELCIVLSNYVSLTVLVFLKNRKINEKFVLLVALHPCR